MIEFLIGVAGFVVYFIGNGIARAVRERNHPLDEFAPGTVERATREEATAFLSFFWFIYLPLHFCLKLAEKCVDLGKILVAGISGGWLHSFKEWNQQRNSFPAPHYSAGDSYRELIEEGEAAAMRRLEKRLDRQYQAPKYYSYTTTVTSPAPNGETTSETVSSEKPSEIHLKAEEILNSANDLFNKVSTTLKK